jgi:DNA-binding transcriptional LysR family regulator
MQERLKGIAAFVQSVEAGSFALAAERMQQTRSAVGKSIARLERRLGVRLFHRTTRHRSLTDDGQAFYERCVRALAELDAAEAELEMGRRAPMGRLRVSAPVVFGRHCVAPILTKLSQQHPGLTIDVSFSDRVVDLVEEGFDIGVRIGVLPDSTTLAARRLGAQRMGICASPSYLAEHGHPQSIDELSTHKAILYRYGNRPDTWRVLDGDDSIRDLRIHGRLRFDDLQAIVDAAIAGAGLAWLPCWLMNPYVHTGELAVVMDSERVLPTDIHVVWPRSKHLPSRTRAAIDALAAEIPRMLGQHRMRSNGVEHRASVQVASEVEVLPGHLAV